MGANIHVPHHHHHLRAHSFIAGLNDQYIDEISRPIPKSGNLLQRKWRRKRNCDNNLR